jgi:hypothetical protein
MTDDGRKEESFVDEEQWIFALRGRIMIGICMPSFSIIKSSSTVGADMDPVSMHPLSGWKSSE